MTVTGCPGPVTTFGENVTPASLAVSPIGTLYEPLPTIVAPLGSSAFTVSVNVPPPAGNENAGTVIFVAATTPDSVTGIVD